MLSTRETLHPASAVTIKYPSIVRPSSAQGARSCVSCSLKGVCLPCGLDSADIATFSILVHTKLKIARGASLFRAGDAMGALYIVHSGVFKTLRVSREGGEKVTGFCLAGEMLGLDAINARTQCCEARALEDSEVCVVPFELLQHMAQAMPALQQQLLRVLSDDISRDQGLMLLLGGMRAEQRLAAFLLSLSRRYRRLGYSPERFVLHMTRDDIGSYLGLATETVSRLLSQFQRDNLVSVHHREVRLTDPERLTDTLGVW
jgi:CRP/FNR family transcriptional regulator